MIDKKEGEKRRKTKYGNVGERIATDCNKFIYNVQQNQKH
jgi:hypothetical protein